MGYYVGSVIAVENFDDKIGAEDNKLAVLLHEWGHYIDLKGDSNNPKFATNTEVLDTYNEELTELQQTATKEQQQYVNYFTIYDSAHLEKVAETHSILYSRDCPMLNMRRFHLAQYFPRTMAAIMKLLLAEEGVKI